MVSDLENGEHGLERRRSRTDLLKPVRDRCSRITRVAAMNTSAAVDTALMEMAKGCGSQLSEI
jgi:hypothetical protein